MDSSAYSVTVPGGVQGPQGANSSAGGPTRTYGGAAGPQGYRRPPAVYAGSNLQNTANVATIRSLLRASGYKVDPAGPRTARLMNAWADYHTTKGVGAASWNLLPQFGGRFNPAQPLGGTNPKGTAAAGGGRTNPKGQPHVNLASQVPGLPGLDTPGSPGFEDLFAGVGVPKNPVNNLQNFATNYAKTQANAQFNPVIAALNSAIGRQGADSNAAQLGLDSLYAQPIQQAQNNVATASAPTDAGIKTVGQAASSIGQAFGLGPATPGATPNSGDTNTLANAVTQAVGNNTASLAATGAANTQSAKDLLTNTLQSRTDAGNAWQNQEQQNINGLRDQLIQAISGKGTAKAAGYDTGLTTGQGLETNYLGQLNSLQTGREQAALADQAYQSGAANLTGKTLQNQGQAYQNQTAPLKLRDQLLGDAASRKNAAATLVLNQKTFSLNKAKAIASTVQQAGGWGSFLTDPSTAGFKNRRQLASDVRSLLVDPKTNTPIANLTPSSAYTTISQTLQQEGLPDDQTGRQYVVSALRAAGFDLTGYQLTPNGLTLIPKSSPHSLSGHGANSGFTGANSGSTAVNRDANWRRLHPNG